MALVRIDGLGPTGPAAPMASGIAIEPFSASIIGPGPRFTLAVPTSQGLPALFDSALNSTMNVRPSEPADALDLGLGPILGTWAELHAPAGAWMIVATSVTAFEPLDSFHTRVDSVLTRRRRDGEAIPGTQTRRVVSLDPQTWESERRQVRERGLALPAPVVDELNQWAERLGVTPLGPGVH